MSGTHVLVVAPFDPESDDDRFDVEHSPDCPLLHVDDDEDGNPILIENCGVGFHLDQYGFTAYFLHADDQDSIDTGQQRVPAGRHEIELWTERIGGSCGLPVEWNSGVCLAAPATAEATS